MIVINDNGKNDDNINVSSEDNGNNEMQTSKNSQKNPKSVKSKQNC